MPTKSRSPTNFNPRSREGSDNRRPATAASYSDFNPRSREGSDAQIGHRHQSVHISIHAPVKGATTCRKAWMNDSLFQSTLP